MQDQVEGINVYEQLRNDILDLRLRPGMIISLKDICDGYKAGRTPVREAVIRLSKEGLAVFLPQRGTMVSKISMEKAEEERFLRGCVEERVLERFLEKAGEEEFRQLRKSVERQKILLQTGDSREFFREDGKFHSVFYHRAGLDYSYQILSAHGGDYHRIRLLTITDQGISGNVIRQHQEIILAAEERNLKQLISVFRVHISCMTEQERGLREKYPGLFSDSQEEERRNGAVFQEDFLETCKSGI